MINKNKKLTNNIKFNRRKEINKMKTKIFTICIMVMALVIVAFGAVGCKKATGGGWIPVYDGDELLGKATFGFQTRCETIDEQAVYTGNVQYNDHYNNIKLHGTVYYEPLLLESCEELEQICEEYPEFCSSFEFKGIYKPQPKGESGNFILTIEDNGKHGVTNKDYFKIELADGKYGDYSNEGFLGGGNIQIKVK